MISFSDMEKLFSCNLEGNRCIEIEFAVNKRPSYQSCWMGKMPGKEGSAKEIYWFGLVPDGSQAFDYDNFRDFSNAPVFDGGSLREIWEDVEVHSIDGCDPKERIRMYLSI